MKFSVVWTPTAQDDLARIWLQASDRSAVSSAAQTIDQALERDPQEQGESRRESVRVLMVTPLGVDFEVIEEDRRVYVLTVWSY
jgi:plasmid stabilization system protein ParE